jgi:hypothetical protein
VKSSQTQNNYSSHGIKELPEIGNGGEGGQEKIAQYSPECGKTTARTNCVQRKKREIARNAD